MSSAPLVESQPSEGLLARILESTRAEIGTAQAAASEMELRGQLADAPPVRSLSAALRARRFSLIAEIKHRSPSQGPMRPENVAEALSAYSNSDAVAGISVLTNRTWFDTSIDDLRQYRSRTAKPILRKEFIIDQYQLVEARAAGADAVLLMANVLTREGLRVLSERATELGLEVLFEVHTAEEIEKLPARPRLCGINSRTFAADAGPRYAAAQEARATGHAQDLSTDLERFALVEKLPPGALKIAESGITPAAISQMRDTWKFDAALIGTSLLLGAAGIRAKLAEFEAALGEV